jgi:hypothetical protein
MVLISNKPDYYHTESACKKSTRAKVRSNPRYSKFYQTHYTAGDSDQFESTKSRGISGWGAAGSSDVYLENNVWKDADLTEYIEWEKYKDVGANAADNTFKYMFNKFKKGIYVRITDNKLETFLPFSKKNFINEWSHLIKVDPKYVSLYNMSLSINKTLGKRWKPTVNSAPEKWYANNCLIRYESPISEGDTNTPQMRDMLMSLCKSRKIPDIEFFINRRDFPVIRKDSTEAYTEIFGHDVPLVSHNYSHMAPIMGMVTTESSADIPWPTGDDWDRVTPGKFFAPSCRVYQDPSVYKTPWNDRKPTAVWRGASTGCGVTVDTNQRLKLAQIGASQEKSNPPLLDAGITKWNLRVRKLAGEKYLKTIDVSDTGIKLVSSMTPQEQSTYKYLVHVDGHVAAFRLSREMSMGCCILMAKSPYSLWFRSLMKPMIHYIPLKGDLSDLLEKVKWCRENDSLCNKIANNARKFYYTYLTKESQMDYMQKILVDIKDLNGVYMYNVSTPLDVQLSSQRKYVHDQSQKYPTALKSSKVYTAPRQSRSYGTLKGYEYLMNYANMKSKDLPGVSEGVIFSSKTSRVEIRSFAGKKYVVKTTNDFRKTKENVHEVFLGLSEINELSRFTPNFAYIFGYHNECVCVENINGVTLDVWLKSPGYNFKDYLIIVLQLSLSLEIAQRKCGFVHWDLAPWNIVIQTLQRPINFGYIVGDRDYHSISTHVVPVIIDYGKSHIIHEGTHYGMINMYKTPTAHDVVGLLVTSLHTLVSDAKAREDASEIVALANFLSGTAYARNTFKVSGPDGLAEVRKFVSISHSYDELVYSDKGSLNTRTPIDLFNYIKETFRSLNLPTVIVNDPQKNFLRLDGGNPRQVFNYGLSNTVSGRLASFMNVFDTMMKCDLYKKGTHYLLAYYVVQSIETNAVSVRDSCIAYLTKIGMGKKIPSVIDSYNNVVVYLTNALSDISYKEPIISTKTDIVDKITDSIFLDPDEVVKRLRDNYKKTTDDMSGYRELIATVLAYKGSFEVSDKLATQIRDSFSNVIGLDSTDDMVNNANRVTLRSVSSAIYDKNVTYIESEGFKTPIVYKSLGKLTRKR